MKKFHFFHGHLYFSEKHLYFTTDITIFQSIFYKLVIFYFLFVYIRNTLPHIVHKAALFVRIYPVPCKHFSGPRLSPAEMRFPFTYPDVYLTGIHPCCPTIFPGWGCIFPSFLKRARSRDTFRTKLKGLPPAECRQQTPLLLIRFLPGRPCPGARQAALQHWRRPFSAGTAAGTAAGTTAAASITAAVPMKPSFTFLSAGLPG